MAKNDFIFCFTEKFGLSEVKYLFLHRTGVLEINQMDEDEYVRQCCYYSDL